MDSLREWVVGRERIEYIVEGTTEHCLYLENLITRVAKVIDCAYNRKSCSHIGLKEELYSTVAGCALKVGVIIIITGCSDLICSHYADVMLKERLINARNIFRSSAIYKYTVKDIHSDNAVKQVLGVRLL